MKAICPGSFDPVTCGHLDVIRRAARTFDHIVVTVLNNPRKKALFNVEERVEMLHQSIADMENVSVAAADGLLVDFARSQGAQVIVKGLRPIQDFDYEWQMGMVNMELDQELETYYVMSRKEYGHLSSSIVRELAFYGGSVDSLVPAHVAERLRAKYGAGR